MSKKRRKSKLGLDHGILIGHGKEFGFKSNGKSL